MTHNSPSRTPHVIGRVELIDILTLNTEGVHAKVDTGADLCSIWTSHAKETEQGLECIFFGPESPYYTGEKVIIPHGKFTLTRVSSSFGNQQYRYKTKLKIRLANRVINATFTLADRGNKLYPALLGRRLLHSKFLVDVSGGKPLIEAEKNRKIKLKKDLKRIEGLSS